MPERSTEIDEMLRGWLAAKMRGDREAIVAALSEDPCVVAIGTDESEWFQGPAAFADLHGGAGAFDAEIQSLDAWREGTIGWATARAAFPDAGGAVRLSVVLHQENGVWKVVQTHASVGS